MPLLRASAADEDKKNKIDFSFLNHPEGERVSATLKPPYRNRKIYSLPFLQADSHNAISPFFRRPTGDEIIRPFKLFHITNTKR